MGVSENNASIHPSKYTRLFELLHRHPELGFRRSRLSAFLKQELLSLPTELCIEVENIFNRLIKSKVFDISIKGKIGQIRASIAKNALRNTDKLLPSYGEKVHSQWLGLKNAYATSGLSQWDELFIATERGQDIDALVALKTPGRWLSFVQAIGFEVATEEELLTRKEFKFEDNRFIYEIKVRIHTDNRKDSLVLLYLTIVHKASRKKIILDLAEQPLNQNDSRTGYAAPTYDRLILVELEVDECEELDVVKNINLLEILHESNSIHGSQTNLTDEVARALRTIGDTCMYCVKPSVSSGIALESAELCTKVAEYVDYHVSKGGKLEGRRLKEIMKDILRLVMLQGSVAYTVVKDMHIDRFFPFSKLEEEEISFIFEAIKDWDLMMSEMILNPGKLVEIMNLFDPRLV